MNPITVTAGPRIQRLRQQVLFIPESLWRDLETLYAASTARQHVTGHGIPSFHDMLVGMLRQQVIPSLVEALDSQEGSHHADVGV